MTEPEVTGGETTTSKTTTDSNANPGGNVGNSPKLPDGVTLEDEGKVVVIDGKRFVVQDHVNQLVGSARKDGKEAGKTEAQRAAEAAAEADRERNLTEQGKYKEALDIAQKRVTDLESEVERLKADISERDLRDIRRSVAKAAGLPDSLADRVKGTTEEEMREDAEALAKSVGTPVAPDTQTGNKPGSGSNNTGTTVTGTPPRPKDESPGTGRRYVFQGTNDVKW